MFVHILEVSFCGLVIFQVFIPFYFMHQLWCNIWITCALCLCLPLLWATFWCNYLVQLVNN